LLLKIGAIILVGKYSKTINAPLVSSGILDVLGVNSRIIIVEIEMDNKKLTLFIAIVAMIVTTLTACMQSTAAIPPTLTPEISPTPYELPTGPGVKWDLVVIGDSSMWKLNSPFAAQIEKDVGVEVTTHDVTLGGLEAGRVLKSLRTGEPMTYLQDKLREAEVVVMFVNPMKSIDPENPHDFTSCFDYKEPGTCSMDTFEKYIADLKGIWEEIFKLREGQPTILRATDLYNPLVTNWQEHGVFEACTECWVNMSEANRIAAEAYNIPFLSRLEAFSGPDLTENPREKGFIAKDGEHPTELMGQYTAELLSQLGYDPVIPP
jgi:hypothetical protein